MHLKEIINDNNKNSTENKNDIIKLDEQIISSEDLLKKQNDKSIRIIEISKNNYKTLKHLR